MRDFGSLEIEGEPISMISIDEAEPDHIGTFATGTAFRRYSEAARPPVHRSGNFTLELNWNRGIEVE